MNIVHFVGQLSFRWLFPSSRFLDNVHPQNPLLDRWCDDKNQEFPLFPPKQAVLDECDVGLMHCWRVGGLDHVTDPSTDQWWYR